MAMKKSEIQQKNQFATASMPNLVTPPVAQPVQAQQPVVEPAKETKESEKVRMSIYVNKSAKAIIEANAKAKNTSVSKILTEILDDYAKKNETYAKEYFALQEKIEAMTAEFNSKMAQ